MDDSTVEELRARLAEATGPANKQRRHKLRLRISKLETAPAGPRLAAADEQAALHAVGDGVDDLLLAPAGGRIIRVHVEQDDRERDRDDHQPGDDRTTGCSPSRRGDFGFPGRFGGHLLDHFPHSMDSSTPANLVAPATTPVSAQKSTLWPGCGLVQQFGILTGNPVFVSSLFRPLVATHWAVFHAHAPKK